MNVVIQLICVALMVFAAPAWADSSRDDAAAVAQRASGGRVLSVEKFELAINNRVATELALHIPKLLLQRADKVFG